MLLEDSGGRYWIGTTDGLFRMNDDKSLTCMIMGEDIYDLYEDSKYNLWISIRMNGMYKRDVHGNFTVTATILPTPTTYRATRSGISWKTTSGNIWFGTFTGLNKYNPTSNQFEVYARNPSARQHDPFIRIPRLQRQTRHDLVGDPITAVSIISTRRQIFSRFMQLTTAGTIA